MRNSNSTSMTQSCTGTTQRHPQLMAHSTIAEGYHFNRARSTESTENALAGKVPSADTAAPESDSSSYASSFIEDRGVPVSPKKLPPTPPRDHGSPYRQAPVQPQDRLLQPRSATIGQPFLSSQLSAGPQPFLRPSSWRHKEEDHGSSIFRSPLDLDSQGPDVMSRDHQNFYTIQRSYAFDDGDESDSEL